MSHDQQPVRIWAEDVAIPTYAAGRPDRNPMFLERRVYQGSSGRVYPYPVIDRVGDVKADRVHRAVFIENRWLWIMVLPEYGGRIHCAYDKTNGYAFIYHNHVIKPALVGLAGPWLSGGVEFNWPQHHRPGTFCPVDWAITHGGDGAMTLWLSEIEPMSHLKGTFGLTVRPDRAVLDIDVRLHNRTPFPQSFHLWTNPAVAVNDHYQAVFPPDVRAVYDHGRRDGSSFPMARGTYYKVDYSRGVDLSWPRNIPVPTSYMAVASRYDFLGGYDHGRQAGLLHVADHHVVPGKKMWTWGCGDFGRAWDRNLTDDDGPYAELMCGVFADNQPDFSWLAPGEEKRVRQHLLPYKGIGIVRNATADGAVSLDVDGGRARFGAYATGPHRSAVVRLTGGGEVLWERVADLDPEHPVLAEADLPAGLPPRSLRLELRSAAGRTLVAFVPEPETEGVVPPPAEAIPEPSAVPTIDALYRAGLHLEQYRHASRDPEDYYREALRRDPEDARCSNALGRLLLRRGRFVESEPWFRRAVRTLTGHNANPADGEPFYNLGLALRFQGRLAPAAEAFHKAAWTAAGQDVAELHLAQLAALRGRFEEALDHVEQSLLRNAVNQQAVHLRILLLRRLGREPEARSAVDAALERDPLDFGARNERIALLRAAGAGDAAWREEEVLLGLMRRDPHTHLEIAADYARAGAFGDALDVLRRVAGDHVPETLGNSRPMVFYFLGYYAGSAGDAEMAARFFRRAAAQDPERCFPNSLESIAALKTALAVNPQDWVAAWCLGNLWYDRREVDEAVACWERARRGNPRFPTVHRNLALAYFNKRRQPRRALRSLTTALALDPTDGRVLFELDLLKKRLGVDPRRRLAFLRRRLDVVPSRDDLTLEYVTLLNSLGDHEKALGVLTTRRFHPWEGGEGKVTGQYVVALLELARRRFSEDRVAEAVALLERCRTFPENLGEGKIHGAQENPVLYHLGLGYHRLGDRARARRLWGEAARGLTAPAPAQYYNDPDPATIYWQGLALQKLGKPAQARERFRTLVAFGRAQATAAVAVDFFAVSLPEFQVLDDDLRRRNEVHGRFLVALGRLGLGQRASALRELEAVLRLDPGYQPALIERHRREARLGGRRRSGEDRSRPRAAKAPAARKRSVR